MSLSAWSLVVMGGTVAGLGVLRWELVDLVLDRIGSVADWMRQQWSGQDSP